MRQDLFLKHAWAESDEGVEGAVVRDEGEAGVIKLRDERLQRLAAEQINWGGPAI